MRALAALLCMLLALPAHAQLLGIYGTQRASGGASGPHYVTSWVHQNGATSSPTVAVTVFPTAGDTLAVFIGATNLNNAYSVSDNASPANTYTAADNEASGSSNCNATSVYCWATFYICAVANLPTTITGNTVASTSFSSIVVDEISGTASSLCLDAHSVDAPGTAPGTGANAVISGSITTTVSGDFIEGGTVDLAGGGTITAGTSPLSYSTQESIANTFMTEGAVKSGSGAVTNGATFTASSASDPFITAVMAFKP